MHLAYIQTRDYTTCMGVCIRSEIKQCFSYVITQEHQFRSVFLAFFQTILGGMKC